MSSSDEKTGAELKLDAKPGGTDAAVTPDQIWVSLKTLARQIAVFVAATLRSVSSRTMILLKNLGSAIASAGAGLSERWPTVRTRLTSSAAKIQWPNVGLKSRLANWRALRPPFRATSIRAKPVLISLAVAFVLLSGLVLYSVATLPEILPTFHPSYILRLRDEARATAEQQFLADLKLAALPQHDAFTDAVGAAETYLVLDDLRKRGVTLRRDA